MLRMVCTLLLFVTLATPARAQNSGEVSPLDRTQSLPPAVFLPDSVMRSSDTTWRTFSELEIGTMAPDFTMDGSQGKPVQLADLRGHWAALVFTQNRKTLLPLKEIAGDLHKAGVSLFGVCRDAGPKLMDYAEREQLPFVVLSDRTRGVSEAYRRYDPDYDVIRPGIVLLDSTGVVRATLPGRSRNPKEVLQHILHVVTGT